jgi:hypothetical protein
VFTARHTSVRTLAVQNPCSRCNKTNKKVQARWRKECLDLPLDAAPCKKAWHSGFKLNDAPKAEWDQWLGANKFALMRRCAPARDHSSVQWINSRSLARTSLHNRVSFVVSGLVRSSNSNFNSMSSTSRKSLSKSSSRVARLTGFFIARAC